MSSENPGTLHHTQDLDAESHYFDEVAAHRVFDEFTEAQYSLVLEMMLRGVAKGGRVLDAGCGSGAWLAALARNGWDAFGVELSPAQVAQAQSFGLNAVVGDLLALPADIGQFDAAILCGVLHHFPSHAERVKVITSVAGVLRPGGVLASIDPNGSNPFVQLAFHLHAEVSPNELCLRERELRAAYREAGRRIARPGKLNIEQPRAPEGPLQAVWPSMRKLALSLSRVLGSAARGNYTVVRSLPVSGVGPAAE
jgi:SAM-dependent methyltransferase